jgi:signal transduction histidine kinase
MNAAAPTPDAGALAELLAQARRLRFADPALEDKFCLAHHAEGLLRTRCALAAAAAFGVLSLQSDLATDTGLPEAAAYTRLIRLGVQIPMWLGLLGLTWWRPARRSLDVWIGLGVLVASLTTVPWHSGWFRGSNPAIGLMVGTLPTVLLGALILPVRWRMVLLMVFAQAVASPALYAWISRPDMLPVLRGALFQNTFYCAVVLLAARLREANDRRLFAQREHLAALQAETARLNSGLAAANAEKDRLIAIIGHDLRGPVAAVALGSAVLQRGAASDPVARAGDIHTAARRLLGLLDNLLDWARLQAGRIGPQSEDGVRPAALAAEVVALHENVARHAQVALAADVPADLTLSTDPAMLATIFRNLVGNALKSAPPGGHVVLALDRGATTADRSVFTVTDDGPGLAPEKLAALGLARGVPPDAGLAPRGLGLVVCREFAGRLGGELWATPGPHGRGLAVHLALPR